LSIINAFFQETENVCGRYFTVNKPKTEYDVMIVALKALSYLTLVAPFVVLAGLGISILWNRCCVINESTKEITKQNNTCIINEKLTKEITDQNNVMSNWINKYGENYLAHAVKENAKKVLDAGTLKPAEMLLREGEEVWFEQATGGLERGKVKLPKLETKDFNLLQNTLFSTKDEKRLNELLKPQEKWNQRKALYKEFATYRASYNKVEKERQNLQFASRKNKSNNSEQELKRLEKQADDYYEKANDFWKANKEDLVLYVEGSNLQRKQMGLRALFKLSEKISSNDEDILKHVRFSKGLFEGELRAKFLDVVNFLATKYECYQREIIIAFDCAQDKDKQLDTYLRTKVRKGRSNLNLMELRGNILKSIKLHPEIRMSINSVFWQYGDIVILKGRSDTGEEIQEEVGKEAVMQSPLRGDNYFSIDFMTNEDVIILGPKQILSDYKEKFKDKVIYLEELNQLQKDFFKVPSKNLS
jgi:hypothetical protein